MIFDSDYLDTDGNSGAQGTGDAPAPHVGYLESPTIDLSSYSSVVMEFSNYYRRYVSECLVEFSINGGANWVDPVSIYSGDTDITNRDGADNDRVYIYFPPNIPGNSNVKFRFKFDGATVAVLLVITSGNWMMLLCMRLLSTICKQMLSSSIPIWIPPVEGIIIPKYPLNMHSTIQ